MFKGKINDPDQDIGQFTGICYCFDENQLNLLWLMCIFDKRPIST